MKMKFTTVTSSLLLTPVALAAAANPEARDIVTTYTTVTYCLDPVWKTATTKTSLPAQTTTVQLPYTTTETDLYYSLVGYSGAWPAHYDPATDPSTTQTVVNPIYKCTGTYYGNTATKWVTSTVVVPTKTATVTEWAATTTFKTTSVITNF